MKRPGLKRVQIQLQEKELLICYNIKVILYTPDIDMPRAFDSIN